MPPGSVSPPGLGDDDVAEVECLAGLDDELLADRGFAAAEGGRDVLGCDRWRRG